ACSCAGGRGRLVGGDGEGGGSRSRQWGGAVNGVARVAWDPFRPTLPRRGSGSLAIRLLIRAAGGLALGSLPGARRSQSAFPRYLARTHASVLDLSVDGTSFTDAAANAYSPALARTLARLPQVRRVATNVALLAAPLDSKGVPAMPEAFENSEV